MPVKKPFLLAAMLIVAASSIAFLPSGTPRAFAQAAQAASTVSIGGMVQDDAGRPLRGARVTVASDHESVSRFADAAGRYKIENLNAGPYQVSATAWGYEVKNDSRELSADAEMNFTLAPQWDVRRLSSADWLSALPENEETHTLRATCIRCHNLSYIVRRRRPAVNDSPTLVESVYSFRRSAR